MSSLTQRCSNCAALALSHVERCPACGVSLHRRCHWCTRRLAPARFVDERACQTCSPIVARAAALIAELPQQRVAAAPAPARVVVVDASFRAGVAGLAVVGALGRYSMRVSVATSTRAEHWALRWAMDIARARDERDLLFHTDCDAVARRAGDDTERRWTVRHVSRSDVREAHELAGATRRRDAGSDLTANEDVPAIRGARA
ncbi:MAG: hypothetical protein LC798_11875 [Chloroflexi bacterium]|nr:hypothetical protein [Chloroflexota bacterium]